MLPPDVRCKGYNARNSISAKALSPSFWVSRTTGLEGVSESEWVVYDDTVIFSTCQFITRGQHAYLTRNDRNNVRTSYYRNITIRTLLRRRDTRRSTQARECNTLTRMRRRI